MWKNRIVSWIVIVAATALLSGCPGDSTPTGVAIKLDPSSAVLATGESRSFTATVTGSSNTAVTWTAICGTVTGTGNTISYTAPDTAGDCTLSATSSADSSKTATATITVESAVTLWTRQFGSSSDDWATSVAVDSSGNILVAGWTEGDLEGSNAGDRDAFVRKYSAAGEVLWTRQFGTSTFDGAGAVSVDSNDNVLVAGSTDGDLEGGNAGEVDAFVRKYSAAGEVLWTRQFGTSERDFAHTVAIDSSGNILVAGSTRGNLEGSNAGDRDAFVRKYSAAGEVLWTRQFGTSSDDIVNAVAVDSSGNILVAGPTRGDLEGSNAGDRDAFVRKYSAAGEVLWTRQFGTSEPDFANAVAVDSRGNVLVAGDTFATLQNPSAGFTDAFVRKYTAAGEVVWTRQFDTSSFEWVYAVAVDSSDNVLVAGLTNGALEDNKAGGYDAFVRKLSP